MPPRKTTGNRKNTARKPAPKKTAQKKPARRRTSRKPDRKLPIGTLFAVIPLLLLASFVLLRFTGEKPAPAPAPAPPKVQEKIIVKQPETIIKEVEKSSVPDTVKLFLFEKNIKNSRLDITGGEINISAGNKREAEKLTALLKKYLEDHKITVDGKDVLTAEDSDRMYSIAFSFPKPAVKKPAVPKATVNYKAKLAIVIDDCGYSIPLAKELADVKYPVTFAVLPFTPYGKETAKLARKAGKTVFIHFPMQPKSYPDFDPGKGALFLNMPETLINAVTKANFEYFPIKLDGANNHTGSAFTESSEKMTQALKAIRKYVPAFLDSYTSGKSVAYDVCQKSGMECGVNNVFLDNEEPGLITVSDKQNHVHTQLMTAAKKALASGSAIAIGHLRKGTVSGLEKSLDDIEKMGVQVVPVTELMN